MPQEIEIEFKNLLTEDEFNQLKNALSFPPTHIEQTNYYFETKSFDLKENGAALRIRKKKDTYFLTLKQPHPEGLLETHDSLTEEEFYQWIHGKTMPKPNTNKQLQAMNITSNDLIYAGYLTTIRQEIEYNETLLVLDHSNYLGVEDYEFELEASSKEHGSKVFYDLLQRYNIAVRQTPSKIERFFDQMSRS